MADQILVTVPVVTVAFVIKSGVLSSDYLLFLSKNMIFKSGASNAQSIKGEMALGESIKFETKAPLHPPPQQQDTLRSSLADVIVNIKREGGDEDDTANKEQLIEAEDMDMTYQLDESDSDEADENDNDDDIKMEDASKKDALGMIYRYRYMLPRMKKLTVSLYSEYVGSRPQELLLPVPSVQKEL